MNNFIKLLIFLLFSFNTLHLFAQKQLWQEASFSERAIATEKQFDFSLDYLSLSDRLNSKQKSLTLPDPNGIAVNYELTPVPVMSAALAKKFPQIKTYIGRSENGQDARISISPSGLHAMVFDKKGLYFIDPINAQSNDKYQAYFKYNLLNSSEKKCLIEEKADQIRQAEISKQSRKSATNERALPPSGPVLRTYRIAIATTGEYAQFHGGTVESALAAIVTTMTRVNGIYERELAIRMVLVANNDQLIYLNPTTDPFTNNSASAYIEEVQADIDQIIGDANYDIGHGFSTGAGGLAARGVCVTGNKGRGVTGTNSPIGDAYDVDYVAHEIGHQFGAPHTFNGTQGSCSGGNRNNNTAYEPGSGVTIMAYAGICNTDNIANNSIPFFHASSLETITTYAQENSGNSCAVQTSTGNSFPIVEAGAGGFSIPISTPFELEGTASDADGDLLFYSWEQFDLGPAGAPNSPAGNAPLFRTYEPTTENIRTFPNLIDLLNGTETLGEILPNYARDLTFNLTVRDNQPIGGVNNDQIAFAVSDVGGPFTVDTLEGNFTGFDEITVRWDVANTSAAPINCSQVNILLSTDGGFTYENILASNTPNDGFETVTLPNISAAKAKIKVAAAQNIFFNLSGSFFSIDEFLEPSFVLNVAVEQQNNCLNEITAYEIQTTSVQGYNQAINFQVDGLPADLSATFTNNNILPGESTVLNISHNGTEGLSSNFTLIAESGAIRKSLGLGITIIESPSAIELIGPTNNATNIPLKPTIFWDDKNLLTTYAIDIATDIDFNNIIASEVNLSQKNYTLASSLAPETIYFIRVSGQNNCGISPETISSFSTAGITCTTVAASDVPVSIPNNANVTISSNIVITAEGKISSISIDNIQGTHTYIEDLTFDLISPAGTRINLLTEKCGSLDDFFFSFDDEAASAVISCPPTGGNTYIPAEPLGQLIGESINGTWTLEISDAFAEDGGALEGWEITYCLSTAGTAPDAPTALNLNYLGNELIQLNWVDNATNESGFYVQRAKNPFDFQTIATLSPDITVFEDVLPTNDVYRYRVLAYNSYGPTFSNIISTSLLELERLNQPVELATSYLGQNTISLSWTDTNDNESGHIVEVDFDQNGTFEYSDSVLVNVNTVSIVLPNSDTVSARLRAFNQYTVSDYSSKIDLSLGKIAFIQAPTTLSASYTELDSIELTWNDNAFTEQEYIIERKLATAAEYEIIEVLGANTILYTTKLPTLQEEYIYRIYGANDIQVSEFSNEVSASIQLLSTKTANINSLLLYPNPAENLLSIESTEGQQIVRYSIYDLKGRRVMSNDYEGPILLEGLASGLHLIKVETTNNQHLIRFVKK